jgi:hypothetical protein
MQRRKFVIGLGSLAAGGAAVIGTGAQSQESAEREARFVIEPDSSSPYLKLDAPDTLENGEYASGSNEAGVNPSDQLVLTFNDEAEVTGDGLSADAEHWFDSVFRVTNHGANPLQTFIDDDNLDDTPGGGVPLSERIVFYEGQANDGTDATSGTLGSNGSPLEGFPGSGEGPFTKDDDNSKDDYSGSAGNGWQRTLNPGDSVEVGVYIDTRNLDAAQDLNPSDDTIQVKGEMP